MAPGQDPIWTGMLLWVVDLNVLPGPGMAAMRLVLLTL